MTDPGAARAEANDGTVSASAARAAAAPPIDASVFSGALIRVLQRLDDILAQEELALMRPGMPGLAPLTARKNECLIELTKLARSKAELLAVPAAGAQIARTRSQLSVAAQRLDHHIRAVRDVTEAISEAIRRSESDGTYTRQTGRDRR